MFTKSSDLVAQINTIIQKNSLQESADFDLTSIQAAIKNAKNFLNKNCVLYFKKPEVEKLEERVERLEDQNDQLLCIVYFLFQTISDSTKEFNEPEQFKEEKIETKMYTSSIIKDKRVSNKIEDKGKPALTKRETDIFCLLEKGLCAKEIARTLFISETTVITHKKNLKEKFNAKNTVELISKVLTTIE